MDLYGEQYVHTLIPDRADFVPQPDAVALFFDQLGTLAATPLQAKLAILKLSGKFRTGRSALTGEPMTVPVRQHFVLKHTTEISATIGMLEHYDVRMSGGGPPSVVPFQLWQNSPKGIVQFDAHTTYALTLACCLRPQPVLTSYKEDQASPRKCFGEACDLEDRTGYFPNPFDGSLISVPNAGNARFWIEFELGKWIFPKIEDSFNVLNPRILTCAEQVFGSKFAQGCHWI